MWARKLRGSNHFHLTGAVLACALSLAPIACGSDAIIIFRTSFGTIDSSAVCNDHGGHFPLREQGGLVVIVFFDDDSMVTLPNGVQASCAMLAAGRRASVRGRDENGGIRATEVHILGP